MTDYALTAQLSVPVRISTEIRVSSQPKMEANLNKRKKMTFVINLGRNFGRNIDF